MIFDDLIKRLEAATEGSRELDARIHIALNPDQRFLTDPGSVRHPRREPVYGLLRDFPLGQWDDWRAVAATIDAGHYTTSIGAALALVPEGINTIKLSLSRNAPPERQFCHATLEQDADSLGRDMRDDEECEIEAFNAPSGALALCIAALRAKAAEVSR